VAFEIRVQCEINEKKAALTRRDLDQLFQQSHDMSDGREELNTRLFENA
jgi:hypothetical protein